jgi:hypothetical protein
MSELEELAVAKFVRENQHKRTIRNDIAQLKRLMPWIGTIPLNRIHIGTQQPWIDSRRKEGVTAGTINHGLKMVRRILNLAQSE